MDFFFGRKCRIFGHFWQINHHIITNGNIYLGLTEILDKPAYKQEKGDKRKDKSAKKTKQPLQ